MTIGIYKLNFKGTNKAYIGQSTTSIEKRYINHLRVLRKGIGAKKLQEAFNLYGDPKLEILIEAEPLELDELEKEAISVYDTINNGFNTLSGGSTGNGQFGEAASNSHYTNAVYENILKLLAAGYSVGEIEQELGVTKSVVVSIKKCENHTWLEKAAPFEYAIVKQTHEEYCPKANNAKSRGIEYPPIVNIRTKKRYIVESLRESARVLGLDPGNLSKLLNGQVDSYKGFMLETNIQKSSSKYVKAPDGVVHEIPYRGLTAFAQEHGLAKSKLSELLNKKCPQYNGWTLP